MTPHKQIEQQLKECERKFLNALQECPLAVTLTSAIDYRYIEVNNTFERISGWNRDEVIGKTPFDINLWIDPQKRIDFVKGLLSGNSRGELEIRARLKNREVWVGVAFAALIEINSEPCVLALIANVMDVKGAEEFGQAETTLSSMARTLIRAQEDERISIARELHNYVDHLLLLSQCLDRSPQDSLGSSAERNNQIADARRKIEDLALDIQNLSQRLHSSKLEYLGLETAAASFCKELSAKEKVEVRFTSDGIPKDLPPDVSLCLFRVLQESLQNALGHGISQSVEVLLGQRRPNEVCLTIRDSGNRLDVEQNPSAALGLALMKERLKLVGGNFAARSQHGEGTTIEARVQVNSKVIPHRQQDNNDP